MMYRMQTRHISCMLFTALLIAAWPFDAVRALYRGDEFEPRTYNVGRKFFIHRAAFQPLTENLDRFDAATNAYMGAAGSLGSTDLYLYQQLKVQKPLNDTFFFHAHYLRDRDFDSSFQHFTLGLEYQLSPEWAVELVGEPNPDKELADIGGALSYRGRRGAARVQWLFPDFVFDSKNPDDARMEKSAPNIQLDVRYHPADHWTFRAQGDLDLSRTLVNPTESFEYRFEKYQWEFEARRRLCEKAHLRAAFEGEHFRQRRDGLEPEDPRAFSTDREYYMGTLEYLRQLKHDARLSAGAIYVRFDEDNVFPYNPEETMLLDRHDHMLYLRRTLPIWERAHINTFLIVNVADTRRIREEEDHSYERTLFLARAAASLMLLGPSHQFEAGAALSMDHVRFGGGFVRVYVDF